MHIIIIQRYELLRLHLYSLMRQMLLCKATYKTNRPKLFLTMRPSWQVVYYGETVTLYCQMNIDIPGLQYQWYKDGERLNICTISAIVWSDQGEYKCQAHTGKPSVQLYTSRPLLLNISKSIHLFIHFSEPTCLHFMVLGTAAKKEPTLDDVPDPHSKNSYGSISVANNLHVFDI
uniref:Ig-like domain-containing protein n=1 Tax=Erpetoichthys calabaricus TaxID=27687 RepID=A0A8C4XD70_ERPCA